MARSLIMVDWRRDRQSFSRWNTRRARMANPFYKYHQRSMGFHGRNGTSRNCKQPNSSN